MIIVTGGAGFIGSCLISALNARGEKDIWVVDSLGVSDKWKNLVGLSYSNYLDKAAFLEFLQRGEWNPLSCRGIFHLGACSRTTEKNATFLFENNTHYTEVLAQFAVLRNIPFLYASSAATYGDGKYGYEDDLSKLHTLRPKNMYGYSKHIFDLWALERGWFEKIVGFKFFNVFGPNENHKEGMTSIVWNAFHQILDAGSMRLFKSNRPEFKDGEQRRDFIYVKDVLAVMLWFFDHPEFHGLYNLGSGFRTTWNQITHDVFHAMGIPPKIEYVEMPDILKDHYQYDTCASMQRLKQICPVPFRTIQEGVSDYVQNHLMKGKNAS
jgi:ADP-L-glycero-D-manno-heptose 6-epimerase